MTQMRWDSLTSPQIKQLAEQKAIVILPVGSTEQHGPHLAVGCDSIVATEIAQQTAQMLNDKGVPCIVAPTITVANSAHHMHFCGSMTLSPSTFIALLTDYCKSIASHGFRKILLLNGHGGNIAPISTALVTINQELGFPVFSRGYWTGSNDIMKKTLTTQSGMIHACEAETSFLLAIDPSLVDPCYKETKGECIRWGIKGFDSGAMSTFIFLEKETRNGAEGNPYAATEEKGKQMMDVMAKCIAEELLDEKLWEFTL